MPGRLFLTRPIARAAAVAGAPVPAAVPPRRNMKPGEEVMVLRPGPVLVPMRWGLIPSGRVNARGRPVMETIVNARSETLFDKTAFADTGRAAVPADGWYEWTGARGRKTAWRIQARDGRLLWFAAICDLWTAPGGREVWQVATVTCPPSADVRAIHDRMGVLLSPDDLELWLTGPEDRARALLQTPPPGLLEVEKAEGVDWSAP